MFPRWQQSLLILFHLYVSSTFAFYIPGFSIKSYLPDESIPLFVNKIYSDRTQLQYAYSELPFVCPASGRKHPHGNLISGSSVSLNLGEIIRGDRIVVSDYELAMLRDDEAHYLCTQKIDASEITRAQELISDGYVAEWIVDNLPGATQFVTPDRSRKYYAAGFKIGYEVPMAGEINPWYYINNHVSLVIRYNTAPGRDGRKGRKVIVGFEVYPKSIEAEERDEDNIPYDVHGTHRGLRLRLPFNGTVSTAKDSTLYIPYTYSVIFKEEERIDWSNRWDLYFVNQEDSSGLHWLAIVNSLIIAGLLSGVVAVILARTIKGETQGRKDSILEDGKRKPKREKVKSPPKSLEGNGLLDPVGTAGSPGDDSSEDDSVEEITGWKLVHADVFRTPRYGHFLAPLLGSGMQLVFMATGLLVLSLFGVLNPSFRGGFVSVGFGLFIFAGLVSGYFSSRIYKTFGGKVWKANVIVTALLIPGLLFTTVFVLNLFTWAQASSTALPFTTLLALAALWLLIQLPLVYAGGYYGFHQSGPWEHPIKTNAVPRQIPTQSWWIGGIPAILISGLLPFAVVFVELLFVFKSLWLDKSGFYYVFGFTAVVSAVLLLTVMEVTIVTTYLLLCYENYRWWWHSFAVGASSGLWIFAYCAWYYAMRLHIEGLASGLLFFSYTALACAVYSLLMGTVGFFTAYVFVRRIYGAIKVD
ncbi:MAG: hypothetical protein M1828_005766 [Chrysothrix sp. TS-e1954]|nr:MAG: hypothetical protein M1828_005766 [Chrysothrix sp. TS-e1954]